MKNKGFVEQHLDFVESMSSNLINDINSNKLHITKEYILEKLEILNKSVNIIRDRVRLEDEVS